MLFYPSEECDVWHHNAQSYVAISSRLPYRTLLPCQVEWDQFALYPHYLSLSHGLYVWNGCHKIFCGGHVFKHLIEDGGEGDWAQFDFTDLFHFLKYREDQYLFQEENVYGNGPVQPAKWEILLGLLLLLFLLVIQQVHYQGMLLCET